jgi:hypothetical protein
MIGQHWEFIKKVLGESQFQVSGCILYKTHLKSRPSIRYQGKVRYAARRLWELLYGEIPEGLSTLHSCDNGYCVNLDHIRLGTQRENIKDMWDRERAMPGPVAVIQRSKTHCPSGHEYNEKNMLVRKVNGVFRNRYCKTCKNERRNARYVRKKK